MTTDTITKTVFFNVDAKTVWSYLTDKDKIAQWFHPLEANIQEGKDYALVKFEEDGSVTKICWGTVLHFEPPEKLVWSFTVAALEGRMTTVTWTIDEISNGSRLTMVHEGVGAAAGDSALTLLGSLDKGWDEHLGSLRTQIKGLHPAVQG